MGSYLVGIYVGLIPIHIDIEYDLYEAIAVFSSVIFLSFILNYVISKIFLGLQDTINAEQKLISDLANHQEILLNQNLKLQDISWINSHLIRTPITRLMGIVEVFNECELTKDEKEYLIENIHISAKEIDILIQDISNKSEEINIK